MAWVYVWFYWPNKHVGLLWGVQNTPHLWVWGLKPAVVTCFTFSTPPPSHLSPFSSLSALTLPLTLPLTHTHSHLTQAQKRQKEEERRAYIDPAKSLEEKELGNACFKEGSTVCVCVLGEKVHGAVMYLTFPLSSLQHPRL